MLHLKDFDRNIFIICPYKHYLKDIKSLLNDISLIYAIKCIIKDEKMCICIFDGDENVLEEKLKEIIGDDFVEHDSANYALEAVQIKPEKKLYYTDLNMQNNSSRIFLPTVFSYSNMRPETVMKKYGIQAVATLWAEKNSVDNKKYKRTILAIEEAAYEWILSEETKNIEDIELDEIKEFIIYATKIVPNVMQDILNKSSYISIESFLEADEIVLRSAYATIMKNLKNTFKK